MAFLSTVGPQLAGDPTTLIILTAAAVAARLLFRPKKETFVKDNRPSTSSLRGSFVPWLIGRRRVGPIILWVGGREVRKEPSAGGKGSVFGGSPEVDVYYEQGVHALVVGQAHRIAAIYRDGKNVLPESTILSEALVPSGASIDLGSAGSIRVYWGESSQPIDPLVSNKIAATRLPRLCYIVWDKARLGENPNWSNIEYDVEVLPWGGSLPGVTAYNPDNEVGGVNYAVALWQVLTGKYPYGLGIDPSRIDWLSLVEVGTVTETEDIWCNIIAQDGLTADRVISEILQDIGCFVVECGGKIAFSMLREEASPPVVSNDLVTAPRTKVTKIHIGDNDHDRLVFRYADQQKRFRDAVITRDDDSAANASNNIKAQDMDVATATRRSIVSRIANRRELEEFAEKTAISFRGGRELRRALPGQVIDVGEVAENVGPVRIISVRPKYDEMVAEIEGVVDAYSIAEPADYIDPDLPVEETTTLALDIRWQPYEVPYWYSTTAIGIVVPRVRANNTVAAGRIWVSQDGNTYTNLGNQPNAIGGTLAEPWGSDSMRPIVADGPLIDVDDNGDVVNALDLTGEDTAWLQGRQILIIGQQILFVRRLEFVSGTTYRCKDVITGRFDTLPAGYSSGQQVFVVDTETMPVLTNGPFTAGQTWFVKSQPFAGPVAAPLSEIMPQPIALQGKGNAPIGPVWAQCGQDGNWTNVLRAFSGNGAYYDEVQVRCIFVNRAGGGAGEDAFGQPVIPPQEAEDLFYCEVYSRDGASWPDPEITRTAVSADADGLMAFNFDRDDLQAITGFFVGDAKDPDGTENYFFEVYEVVGSKRSPSVKIFPEVIP